MPTIKKLIVKTRSNRRSSSTRSLYPNSLVFLFLFLSGLARGQSDTAHKSPAKSLLNDTLILQLYNIDLADQQYRNQMEPIRKKYGPNSKELAGLLKKMQQADSINILKVTALIDKYGWLGPDVVGRDGNTTLFMVIQHSNLNIQEKYLPLMRHAVQTGDANPASLALLEDRVALRQGKKQLYGSQLSWNMKTNEYFVLPLENPDSVDIRRAAVGLGPLADYVMDCCHLIWNVEQYKKDLPKLEVLQTK